MDYYQQEDFYEDDDDEQYYEQNEIKKVNLQESDYYDYDEYEAKFDILDKRLEQEENDYEQEYVDNNVLDQIAKKEQNKTQLVNKLKHIYVSSYYPSSATTQLFSKYFFIFICSILNYQKIIKVF